MLQRIHFSGARLNSRKKNSFVFKKVDFPVLLRYKPLFYCEAAVQDRIITEQCKINIYTKINKNKLADPEQETKGHL